MLMAAPCPERELGVSTSHHMLRRLRPETGSHSVAGLPSKHSRNQNCPYARLPLALHTVQWGLRLRLR